MSLLHLSPDPVLLTPVLGWAGTLLCLAGSLLLASRIRFSYLAWPVFLVANVLTIGYSVRTEQDPILVQQLGFVIANLVGIWRWRTDRSRPMTRPMNSSPARLIVPRGRDERPIYDSKPESSGPRG